MGSAMTRRIVCSMLLLPALAACQSVGPAIAQGERADFVVVEKSKHTLALYKQGKLLATYHVAFGGDPVGPKQREGDEKTPEGRYAFDYKNAATGYHKAIHVSYPNAQDIALAKQQGVSPGGAIMVHGQKNHYGWAAFITQRFNWTHGCIALSDEDMDEVWDHVHADTPVEIRP